MQGATRLCVSSPCWAPGSALPWDVGCCGPAHRGLMGPRRDVEGWGPEAVEKGFCQERLLEQCTWRGSGEQRGSSGSFRRHPLICPDFSCTFTRGDDRPCRLGQCCEGLARAQGPWWLTPSAARCEVPCAPLQSPLDPVATSQHYGGSGAKCGGRLKPQLGRHWAVGPEQGGAQDESGFICWVTGMMTATEVRAFQFLGSCP